MQAETVLITAANRGIGLALSEALLREGYVVIAGCRHPEAATHLQRLAASQTGLIDAEGITTAAISPGWVRTDMGGSDATLSPEESARSLVQAIQTVSPELNGQFLDRFGKPGEYPW